MYLLYSQIFLLMMLAIIFLAIPFVRGNILLSKTFGFLSISIFLFTISLYFFVGSPFATFEWINHGREHYFLLMQFDKLGGVDGIIQKVKLRLEKNPNDIQGWLILGKLYRSQNNYVESDAAFTKAETLKQNILYWGQA